MVDQFSEPKAFLDSERFETDEQEANEPAQNTDSDKKIFEQYTKRRKAMEDKWNPIYAESREDWDIYNLKQWTSSATQARGARPRLTVDITRKYVKATIANTHANPPSVKLTARNDSASVKANALGEALRYFEDRSGAIYSYTWAQECAAVGGIGWGKVSYAHDPMQKIQSVIEVNKIPDPFSILIDPDSIELDGSDMIDAVERHGTTTRSKSGSKHKDKVTYWYKDESRGLVKWAVIEGDSVESKGIWAGHYIPIVPTYAEFSVIDGKVNLFGQIRTLRDTQRAFNYVLSEGVERLALTPRAPWMIAKGSTNEKDEGEYTRSLVEPVGKLFYNSYDPMNPQVQLPAPQRNVTTPDVGWIDGLVNLLATSAKETTGIYDSALGNEQQDSSGIAIKARQGASDRGQLVYSEHTNISVKQFGRIMLDLFVPVIQPYGILPAQKEDGTQVQYSIGDNPTYKMDASGQPILDESGQPIIDIPNIVDLDPSDLDVSISSAPAYQTRKQEGMDNMIKVLSMAPEQSTKVMDLVVKSMDFPGGDEMASRLAPQGLAQSPIDPAQQQVMDGLNQQLQQAQQATTDLQSQNQILQMQLQNNAQLEMDKTMAKLRNDQVLAQMDGNIRMALEQIKQMGANDRAQAQIMQDVNATNAKLMASISPQMAQPVQPVQVPRRSEQPAL